MEGLPNPLLLLTAVDVANTIIAVEAARMEIFLIRSSELLLMLFRLRFLEQKRGLPRGEDDPGGDFFIFQLKFESE